MSHRKSNQEVGASGRSASVTKSFFIVGVGASAGGLEALNQLLMALPVDTGMAFVLVQHLLPTHESMSAEIFSKNTRMAVLQVKNGMRVEPNSVYVIPPNYGMVISHGILSLTLRTELRGQPRVIDAFFQSLAEDQKGLAIGIVLSGTGSDGSQGLVAIKAEGGITFAQDPSSAKYDGMPSSAIATGMADLILPPQGIAEELGRISKHPYVLPAIALGTQSPESDSALPLPKDSLTRIFRLLKSACRVDFTHYKSSTITRRIGRRMVLQKLENVDDYAQYLSTSPDEVKALYNDILIHVTRFFRNSEAFDTLQNVIFPGLMKDRAKGEPFRIWVPGCSTGEEVYSVAISLWEFLGAQASETPIQIFASDICEQSIDKARRGEYPESISNQVSPSRIARFFVKLEGGGYKINKSIRDICLFCRHDIAGDPPFAKVDLISCQNLLIYFAPILQKHVIRICHYSLKPTGILWLGRSESIGGRSHLFTLLDGLNKFYRKKETTTRRLQAPSAPFIPRREFLARKPRDFVKPEVSIPLEAERAIRNEYPGVLVNDEMEILQFYGRTSPYLEPASGRASYHLLKMARPELLLDLRIAIQAAKTQDTPVRRDGLSFEVNGHPLSFNMKVLQVEASPQTKKRHYFVLFEKTTAPVQTQAEKEKEKNPQVRNESNILQLQKELADLQEFQGSLIEEYETSQENLTDLNEELQSANEEFQSMNEELETAKEELQSGNEELSAVNDELQERNVEQGQLNSDLINLLDTIEIPILMLGSDYRIRRFTPTAATALNLISTDIGRPVGDLRTNFDSLDLNSVISEVIAANATREVELQDRKGHWYRLQVKPYRNMDNALDGAVVAFLDIDTIKRGQIITQAALDYMISVSEAVAFPLVVLDQKFRFRSANQSFYKYFQLHSGDTDIDILKLITKGKDKVNELSQLLLGTLVSNTSFKDFEIVFDSPAGQRILLLNARKIHWSGADEPESILLAIEDTTDKKKAQDSLNLQSRVLQSMVDGISLSDEQGVITFTNSAKDAMFGYDAGELLGKTVSELHGGTPEENAKVDAQIIENVKSQGEWAGELKGRRKNGTLFMTFTKISQIDISGKTYWVAVQQDITERKQREAENAMLLLKEREARIEAEKANRARDLFLAMLSHELRTPLTAILSWAQVLQMESVDIQSRERGLKTIEKNAKAQERLINDLLDVARIQAGKTQLELDDVDPVVLLHSTLDSVRLEAAAKSIQFEAQVGPSIGKIFADATRIQQVLWNLIVNAIKFSPPNTKVRIHLERIRKLSKEYVQIGIADEGKGISQEFLPQIFNLFSQEDSSTTRIEGGLGLGLTIARNLVELHGGTIEVESAGEGKGTLFTVCFPVLPRNETQVERALLSGPSVPPQKDVDAISLSELRVLLVEDEPSTRDALTMVLKLAGAQVKAVGSVAEALEAQKRFRPDVLVCDIAMPGEDGYSLIKKIRALSQEEGGMVPSIALTAYAGAENVEKTLSAGFQAHVAKPVDTRDFIGVIAKVLNRK